MSRSGFFSLPKNTESPKKFDPLGIKGLNTMGTANQSSHSSQSSQSIQSNQQKYDAEKYNREQEKQKKYEKNHNGSSYHDSSMYRIKNTSCTGSNCVYVTSYPTYNYAPSSNVTFSAPTYSSSYMPPISSATIGSYCDGTFSTNGLN